ncbi:MAG: hypothetical protein NC308_07560 [Clostridium sp.]|nr:hypothetical protein [Bacteroides sp.]MCM1198730.1 hypothetical protein [Clostridium sp.]
MKENFSALYSRYIIDGAEQDHTPGGILLECMKGISGRPMPGAYSSIADETIDLPPASFNGSCLSPEYCLSRITMADTEQDTSANIYYPMASARLGIATALIGSLWKEGNFRLGDIMMKACWKWDTAPVGNMAAFFYSATAAGEYLYDLGVGLKEFTFEEQTERCETIFSVENVSTSESEDAGAEEIPGDEELFCESPFVSRHPYMSGNAKCSNSMLQDKGSWLIYIPFDTCQFRLGGSALSKSMGQEGGSPSEVLDPDYFIDCYEVVREFVEDGIVMSGISVGRGGMMYAADRFRNGGGMSMDISGICMAYREKDPLRILFGEVPGVIIQISDNDYDYVDSQLLLQDVAYYPLGHPMPGANGIELKKDPKSGISGILESLINSQTSEGED